MSGLRYVFITLTILMILGTARPTYSETYSNSDFVSSLANLDIGISYETVSKNLKFYDVDNRKKSLYVGNRLGTHFYTAETVTDVTEHSRTHLSNVRYEMKNYGVFVESRFAKFKNHSIGFGMGKKELPEIHFKRTSIKGWCGKIGGCDIYGSFNAVNVNTYNLAYKYKYSEHWTSFAAWQGEKIKYLQPNSKFTFNVSALSVYGIADWDQWKARVEVTEIIPHNKSSYKNTVGKNMNVELGIDYTVKRHISLDLILGWYSNGVPLAGTDFTSAGQQLIIPHLTGDDAFGRLFDGSFEYITMAITLSLQ